MLVRQRSYTCTDQALPSKIFEDSKDASSTADAEQLSRILLPLWLFLAVKRKGSL